MLQISCQSVQIFINPGKYWNNDISNDGSSIEIIDHSTQNSWNKWTKISVLETNIFQLNMMVQFFYFELLLAPSELPANQPIQPFRAAFWCGSVSWRLSCISCWGAGLSQFWNTCSTKVEFRNYFTAEILIKYVHT